MTRTVRSTLFVALSLVLSSCYYYYYPSTPTTDGSYPIQQPVAPEVQPAPVYYAYFDPHPVPDSYAWCAILGYHEHAYAISTLQYPVVVIGNKYVFVGDSYLWGWNGPFYWYYGYHPLYDQAWCVLDGPHTHWHYYSAWYVNAAYWSIYGGYIYWYGYPTPDFYAWHHDHYQAEHDHHDAARRRWYSDHGRNEPDEMSERGHRMVYGQESVDWVRAGRSLDDVAMPRDNMLEAAIREDWLVVDETRLAPSQPRPPEQILRGYRADDGGPAATRSEPGPDTRITPGLPPGTNLPPERPPIEVSPPPRDNPPPVQRNPLPPAYTPPKTGSPGSSPTQGSTRVTAPQAPPVRTTPPPAKTTSPPPPPPTKNPPPPPAKTSGDGSKSDGDSTPPKKTSGGSLSAP